MKPWRPILMIALAGSLLAGSFLAGPAWAEPPPIIAWRYTVHRGDTLATVAERMGVSAAALAQANGLSIDAPLVTGKVLKRPDPVEVPTPRPVAHIAKPPARVAPTPREPAPVREPAAVRSPLPLRAQQPATPAPASTARPRLSWPTSGALVAQFGARIHAHPDNGIDLLAFSGMDVRAAASGTVLFAGTEPERFGKLIVIDHGNGWTTAYAYLGKVAISEGETVHAGSVIARIGATGEAKKPTLHFELRHDNVPQDPLPALPPRL